MKTDLPLKSIKAVTFDFWWTLFRDKNGLADSSVLNDRIDYLQKICLSKKAFRTRKQVKEAYFKGREFFERNHRKGVFTSPESLMKKIFHELDIKIEEPEARVIGEWVSYLGSFASLELMPHADELLKKLKEKNVKVGLISDTVFTKGKHLVYHLRRHGVLRFFDYLVFSDEVGFVKPQKEVFKTALNFLKARPQESMHIGDFPWSDIEGAKNYGMVAIQFTGGKGPEKDNFHPKSDLVVKSFKEIIVMI